MASHENESFGLCILNAQSVCNKTSILTDYFIEHDFDLVALTETWLSSTNEHQKIIGDLCIPGYDLCHVPRSDRPGGGVALLYKESIKRGPVTSHNGAAFESLCCDLTVNGTFSPVKIVVVYRPPYSAVNPTTPLCSLTNSQNIWPTSLHPHVSY